mgnify:CR=1 FL=1
MLIGLSFPVYGQSDIDGFGEFNGDLFGPFDKNIILLVLIFLLAGAFYAVTIDIGARDATVNMALQFVPSAMILPGLFLICCFISFAMGPIL